MSLIRTAAKAAFAAVDMVMPDPRGPRVLIYHQVGAGLGRQMEVTVDDFRRQMEWLGSNREVVSLDQAIARWEEPGSETLVALTFDDGYRDTHTTAFPILARHGFPFLIYLATESIETGKPLGPTHGAEPLGWDLIGEMLGSGLVTIGAHTHRHTDLRAIDPDRVEEELRTSDDLIERRLGVKPRHFAYPWGHWSQPAADVVDERYETAAVAGTPRPRAQLTKHQLHRYPVQLSDGFRFFPARLRGGLRAEEQVRRWLDRYSGP